MFIAVICRIAYWYCDRFGRWSDSHLSSVWRLCSSTSHKKIRYSWTRYYQVPHQGTSWMQMIQYEVINSCDWLTSCFKYIWPHMWNLTLHKPVQIANNHSINICHPFRINRRPFEWLGLCTQKNCFHSF